MGALLPEREADQPECSNTGLSARARDAPQRPWAGVPGLTACKGLLLSPWDHSLYANHRGVDMAEHTSAMPNCH